MIKYIHTNISFVIEMFLEYVGAYVIKLELLIVDERIKFRESFRKRV